MASAFNEPSCFESKVVSSATTLVFVPDRRIAAQLKGAHRRAKRKGVTYLLLLVVMHWPEQVTSSPHSLLCLWERTPWWSSTARVGEEGGSVGECRPWLTHNDDVQMLEDFLSGGG